MSNLYGTVKHGDGIEPGWGQAIEDAIGAGSPAQFGTYTVYKSGTTYYARHGTTGERKYNDSDFSELMNTIISAMYNAAAGTGGTIILKPGNYTVTAQINMKPGIYVQGSGLAGKLTGSLTGVWPLGTVLETGAVDTTVFSFDYPTPTTAHYFSGLKQMMIYGPEYDSLGTSTKPLIDMQCNSNYLSDIVLDHVYGAYGKYGLRILNNAAATYKIWNLWIDNCLWETCTANGILIDSPTNQVIERIRIRANHLYGNNTTTGNGAIEIDGHETHDVFIGDGTTMDLEQVNGVYMADEVDGCVINGLLLKDAGEKTTNTYSGIKLVDVDHITISGCKSMNRANNKMKYGYEADNNCTYLCVMGNNFKGQTAGASFGTGTGNIGDATTNVLVTG